jgi:uncharacterized membrane protein YhaH (DUF805 family)
MRGTVIGFDTAADTGAINGLDGARYEFVRADWRSDGIPAAGDAVDFDMDGKIAKAIFRVAAAPVHKFAWGSFLGSSTGRISRSQYWLRFTLPYFVISFVTYLIDKALGLGHYGDAGAYYPGFLYDLVVFILLWPAVVVAIKRIHDRGRSGWFYLVMFIPVVQLWPAVEIMFLPGTKGPNRFGPDPVAKTDRH